MKSFNKTITIAASMLGTLRIGVKNEEVQMTTYYRQLAPEKRKAVLVIIVNGVVLIVHTYSEW